MSEQNQLPWQRTNLNNIEQAWDGDLWDRKRLGVQLTSYVDRLNCGAVLALDARWGEGKTWFVRHWKKHLEADHNVIYLDAFANDYLEDPFLVISSEITSCLSKDKDVNQNHINTFKEKAAAAYHALLPSLPKVLLTLGLNLISGGVLGTLAQQVHESGEKVIESATDELGDKIKESIEAKIENHEADKNTLQAFKQELAQLAEELDKPLVFIIDELDRCRPDFAIRLIERIKHFFDIPKIVFVLVMDKAQFSKVICHNYGYDEKLGEEYLDKFVDFSVPLPKINKSTPKEMISIPVLKKLFANVGEFSDDIVFIFYKSLNAYLSPREIKRKINNYSLLKTGIVKKDIFLILKIQSNVTNLITRVQSLNSEVERDFQKNEGSLKNINFYIKENFLLEPKEFVDLFERLRKLNHTTYALSGGENHKKELRLKIYSEYAMSALSSLDDFDQQFEDYLNFHLWNETEKEESD
jgi:hypothetical protein